MIISLCPLVVNAVTAPCTSAFRSPFPLPTCRTQARILQDLEDPCPCELEEFCTMLRKLVVPML